MQNIADMGFDRFVDSILNKSRNSRHLAQEICTLVREVNEHTRGISWALEDGDFSPSSTTHRRTANPARSAS